MSGELRELSYERPDHRLGPARLYTDDCELALRTFPTGSVNCVVTSPPYYGLRDYGVAGQIGLEESPRVFIDRLVAVFEQVRRVLTDDGTCWVNMGDTYSGGGRGAYDVKSDNKGQSASRGLKRNDLFGVKCKDLLGVPWMLAFALRDAGWYLRQEIIWAKPNPMPESVRDRCTKSHEQLFLLTKSPRYYWDFDAMQEPAVGGDNGSSFFGERDLAIHPTTSKKPRVRNDRIGGNKRGALQHSTAGMYTTGTKPRESVKRGGFNGKTNAMPGRESFRAVTDTRNRRSVWTVPTQPNKEAHFASYPPELIRPCIRAGCPLGGVVLDPFSGSGTTGLVAVQEGRKYLGIELNPEYQKIAEKRIRKVLGLFATEGVTA